MDPCVARCRLGGSTDGQRGLSPSQYWASPRSAAFAALAADDPLPGILDLPVLIARMLTPIF
jgi:predicted ATP-grasp superfamily ATP-dependent carboligase